jgi:murein DD-endopeptidase MepM/ murein hydrolase activator NlpD
MEFPSSEEMINLGATMKNIRVFLKKAFASVTIMVIPHEGLKSVNLKIPMVGFIVLILLAVIGGAYTLGMAVNGFEYKVQNSIMAEKVKYYSGQFYQWESTMAGLKTAESRFRTLFSLKSKEEVLEHVDSAAVGSLDLHEQILELRKTIGTVDEIKNYLRIQRDIYASTPKGYPANGEITSNFGRRIDPFSGKNTFHTGIDISCDTRTPIHATADGMVSHSGWIEGSGNVVILEHGFGFSTVYAHNTSNAVKISQKVKRGDLIGYVGSTGKSTGPHVHYEVWINGKAIDAQKYLPRKS